MSSQSDETISPADSYPSPPHAPQRSSTSSSTSQAHAARARTRTRSKSGCLTCRLRKKRCDETRPVCAMCTRLGLECLGFSAQRPDWMRKQEVVTGVVARMKKSVSDTNSAKMNEYWANKAASALREQSLDEEEAMAEETLAEDTEYAEQAGSVESAESMELQALPLPPQTAANFIGDLADLWAYPIPQSQMVDDYPVAQQAVHDPLGMQAMTTPHAFNSGPTSPLVDPDFLALLGFAAPPVVVQPQAATYFPLLHQPTTTFSTSFPTTPANMRFFHHYLTVIMPYQWIFERKVLSDLVTGLAFTNPLVFESLIALAALHMGAKRRWRRPAIQNQNQASSSSSSSRITALPDGNDPDLAVAESSLQLSIQGLKQVPFNDIGSHEMVVAAMSVSSFHLFDGGNRKGWREAVELCRKSLAAVLQGSRHWSSDDPESRLAVSGLVKRMGHLLSPLVWTDILTSVTEGAASQFLSLYRVLLLDDQSQGEMGDLLRETVMGCDSTTRLAIAETIALAEWKDTALGVGRLSIRDLVERANSIERLLEQRVWRERHLFESDDPATLQRRAVSNVFFHSARVLLATTLSGPFPGVVEVAATVRDVADAFLALDLVELQGAERALVFPTVIAGCHADTATLQMFFKDRFERLGEEGLAFGNTRNALRLMEEVWRRRATLPGGQEVHWRKVMFELDEEGLLLI